HVQLADEAVCIGSAKSADSYLKSDRILSAAEITDVDAIHPGYGFLSENEAFAEQCQSCNIKFIGPTANVIAQMGDKAMARELAKKAKAPIIPGSDGPVESEREALKVAQKIGFPVIIKAVAGGGGKGMRLVKEENEILNAIRAARSEARSAFGDDSVYIEKYIESPHHIEFQILADNHGNTIHLFERECSVQRRHQKVVEETPSPLLTPSVREEMGKFAVAAARAVNYSGAGTIEFIVDESLNYYFLEMNTRLQVEHPITERVVGVDLVKEQIRIANNEVLALKQEELKQRGHAIECRIYAEDPDRNFMPSPGVIKHITEPHGLGVRCDGYVYEGYEIPLYYDPMISKLICWGKTRDEAIARMKRALYEYKITGVKTSIRLLVRIMDTPDFREGKYNTHFIEKNRDLLFTMPPINPRVEDVAIMTVFMDYLAKVENFQTKVVTNKIKSNWKACGRRKNMGE
ncbi:MAG TPA: acetyl-CoA carboxylase biotin carboxylase subunit, partial [Bacteroidales bacterium]|nr:acetyl-CoA carboxylase biotin carboxylase subunit [Bacteroidales bacterium]